MSNESVELSAPTAGSQLWRPLQVVVMSLVCLVMGVVVGYLLRGSAPAVVPSAQMAQPSTAAAAMPGNTGSQQMPTLDDLKRMADKKAEPLLAQLKTDPNNAETLNHLGMLYKAAHQFKEAQDYFDRSLKIDPKNASVRTDLASCKFLSGDVDGAIAELQKALSYDPNHAGALMNLGIIEYRAKKDSKAAVASWEKLLKTNPDFPQKELVQHMIEQVQRGQDPSNPMGITKG